ncbi:hypothetical protein NLG97_g6933 [Lecanicillium saksenae]|uniref:Uncharacterized protein n=1 Tax=Lecanicillium saksenae TaxID=468837 RepID=A0ACC1QNC7_9HYPO|nr:hypothetical protein NLG97_g6933 [Lecanicillium saksenae]
MLIKASIALPAPTDDFKAYSELEEALDAVGKQYTDQSGVQDYVKRLQADVAASEEAVKEGDTKKMALSVKKLADDTEEGAHTVEFNDALFQLAAQTAPSALRRLEHAFEAGEGSAQDETKLMLTFGQLLDASLPS